MGTKGQKQPAAEETAKRAAVPHGVTGNGASLQRAEAIRDAIQRSKLTAPDPWSYTARARAWAQQAQALVEEISRDGDTAATRRGLEKLVAEVEGDPDFQEARRRF
jgi:hypothetical protein